MPVHYKSRARGWRSHFCLQIQPFYRSGASRGRVADRDDYGCRITKASRKHLENKRFRTIRHGVALHATLYGDDRALPALHRLPEHAEAIAQELGRACMVLIGLRRGAACHSVAVAEPGKMRRAHGTPRRCEDHRNHRDRTGPILRNDAVRHGGRGAAHRSRGERRR